MQTAFVYTIKLVLINILSLCQVSVFFQNFVGLIISELMAFKVLNATQSQ